MIKDIFLVLMKIFLILYMLINILMYKIDYTYKIFPKNISKLNTKYENTNNNFNIDSIKSLEDYFNKLKK